MQLSHLIDAPNHKQNVNKSKKKKTYEIVNKSAFQDEANTI